MGRDRGIVITSMITRLGFVLALLTAIVLLAGGSLSVSLHMTAGILMFAGTLATTVVAMSRGKQSGRLWGATLLMLVGAGLGIGFYHGAFQWNGMRWVHLIVMILAVGLAEMGTARAHRQG